MNELLYLRDQIFRAQSGDPEAILIVRNICVRAAAIAPVADLIRLAHCVLSIGEEAVRLQIAQN